MFPEPVATFILIIVGSPLFAALTLSAKIASIFSFLSFVFCCSFKTYSIPALKREPSPLVKSFLACCSPNLNPTACPVLYPRSKSLELVAPLPMRGKENSSLLETKENSREASTKAASCVFKVF